MQPNPYIMLQLFQCLGWYWWQLLFDHLPFCFGASDQKRCLSNQVRPTDSSVLLLCANWRVKQQFESLAGLLRQNVWVSRGGLAWSWLRVMAEKHKHMSMRSTNWSRIQVFRGRGEKPCVFLLHVPARLSVTVCSWGPPQDILLLLTFRGRYHPQPSVMDFVSCVMLSRCNHGFIWWFDSPDRPTLIQMVFIRSFYPLFHMIILHSGTKRPTGPLEGQ